MAIVHQRPDNISLSGNLKKYILSSGGVISFVLREGSATIFEASYEPGADGRVTVDVKDIIEARLSYLISHDNFYEQPSIAKTFTAVIDGAHSSFIAIRSGVENLNDTTSNWLRGNFLTWQPVNKQVTYYSPEWLTYYAQEACTIKLKATFPSNTEQTITLGSCDAGKAFTFNLQYAVVAGLLGQTYPQQYEVYAESSGGLRLSYIQQYLYSDIKSHQEQWFLFENSLGGLDTVRASGDTDFTGTHEHKISNVGDTASEYDIDTTRSYSKNTGYLADYERRWLLDFFPSRGKYVYTAGALRAIVVTGSDVKYTASELPSSYNFQYKFSELSPYLNLIRHEGSIPENITIPNIDSPDFILPPRLSEYPRVTLHEGVIFPVFDPNSNQAQITTFGRLVERMVQDVSIAVKDKRLSIRFEFSNGNAFANIPWQTTVTVHVFRGYDEITRSIPPENWNWTRTTTDSVDDNGWNIGHSHATDTLTLRMDDQQNDFGNNVYIDRKCTFTVTVLVPGTGETITEQINYAPY